MKKLIALFALVAMVAVSSVTYAQSDDVVINATVNSTVSLTGCTSVDLSLTPTTKDSDTCLVTIASNGTDGYTVSYSDTDADNDLDSGSTGDSIAALGGGASACVAGADCYSWYISTLNDGTAGTDTNNGMNDFDSNEHTVELLANVEPIISSLNQYSGTFTTTYYGTVDATTEEAADYTNTSVYVIAAI